MNEEETFSSRWNLRYENHVSTGHWTPDNINKFRTFYLVYAFIKRANNRNCQITVVIPKRNAFYAGAMPPWKCFSMGHCFGLLNGSQLWAKRMTIMQSHFTLYIIFFCFYFYHIFSFGSIAISHSLCSPKRIKIIKNKLLHFRSLYGKAVTKQSNSDSFVSICSVDD